MRKIGFLTALAAIVILTSALAFVADHKALPEVGNLPQEATFTEAEYLAHLRFLAGDLLQGRGVGTRGGELAAAYIAAQFEASGLKPLSEESGYFQQVPMLGIRTAQETVSFALSAGEQSVELAPVEEVVINSEVVGEEISLEDDLLFVGYGIEAPEFTWDDYKGADVRGKVLVMLVNDPDLEKTGFGSESLSYYGRWTYKEEIARAKGARGLILLHTLETATYPFSVVQNSWAVERLRLEGELANPLLINCWLSQAAINKALAFVGATYDELKQKADSRDFTPIPLGLTVKTAFKQAVREVVSPNVIGILPGSSMADEAVIYTAHYDHLGIGRPIGGDNIYNGARDNASGVSALICIARAYAGLLEPPQRSVVFFATTAEESGLLGAEYYAAHPVFPLDRTAVVVNMDVFNVSGATDDFSAGIVQYTDAVETIAGIGGELGLELVTGGADKGGGAFRSDHFPFCARGVVALSVGLGSRIRGMSEEESREYTRTLFAGRYHQPNDEFDSRWRYDGSILQLRLCYGIGRHYADGAEPPALKPDNPFVPAIRMRDSGP